MASVGSKNTGPELVVRRALHKLGFRFRLHRKDLPGCPDLVFPKLKKIVFVHGCYWHGHRCDYGSLPKTRVSFWKAKIAGNRERDRRVRAQLKKLGWRTFIVWQCQLRKCRTKAIEKLELFLQST